MSRGLNKLSATFIGSDKLPAGRHSDGGGLYLNVTKTGAKSWIFMWVADGRRREMGLGSASKGGKGGNVSLRQAREKATEIRDILGRNGDPFKEAADRKAAIVDRTFSEAATDYIEIMRPSWKNPKHIAQWEMTLGAAYCGSIKDLSVRSIQTEHVLQVLSGIWHEVPETASRLRGRIEKVLDFAKGKGWRSGENPAAWRGHLETMLPRRKKLNRGHHAALPFDDVPAFMIALREVDAISARALEFLVLTATRTSEALGATWSEVDMQAKIWTIPAARMKAGREHRIPLSDAALDIVRPLYTHRVGDFIFPGQKADKPLSDMSMTMVLRRMKVDVTVHGFRSAFRDWCGDRTTFPRDLAEAALAHTLSDKVEAAYRRSDALEKRRKMMIAWSNFCLTPPSSNVVPMLKQTPKK